MRGDDEGVEGLGDGGGRGPEPTRALVMPPFAPPVIVSSIPILTDPIVLLTDPIVLLVQRRLRVARVADGAR